MFIKSAGPLTRVTSAKIELESGDHLEVYYKDPNGKESTLSISSQHLVLLINHNETNAAMLIRPGVRAPQFLEGEK